jgi:hypothetical protein
VELLAGIATATDKRYSFIKNPKSQGEIIKKGRQNQAG